MRGNDQDRGGLPDDVVWRHSRITDASEDEAARFLDLAGFSDGRLDADEHERVADWLAGDPALADDVAAARELAAAELLDPAPEAIVARAAALVAGGGRPAEIVPFPTRARRTFALPGLARWGSLAAAMAVASWLGFTLGVDTSRSLTQFGQSGDRGFLHELLDPSTATMPDLTESNQT